ncbi:MAG: pitrilysin family protein [Acidobacteriia bacterium]|nr:pitrilysin family protein [Terriglobia bacterium]
MKSKSPTSAAPSLAFSPQSVLKTVLPNGMMLLVCERRHVGCVSLEAAVLAGSRFDVDATAGLASLTARLLTEGTTARSSEEIADLIESVGGSLDSGSGTEGAIISASTLSKDVDLMLDLVADVALRPSFSPDRVALEREKMLSQIQSAQDRPRTVLDWNLNELLYENHPLHRPAIGYPGTVAQLTREAVMDFHRRFFVPRNCRLALVGDFRAEEILKKLEARFGSWEDASIVLPEIPELQPQTRPQERFVEMPKEQVNIFVGHLGIRRNNPDFYALNVMDVILGSAPGMTSRVPKHLRDEQGLAYSAYANITNSAGLDPGRFVAYIGTSPENRRRAIEGIFREMRTMVSEPVLPEELRSAQRYLTGSFVFHFQTTSQIAHFLIQAERYGLGFDYPERYPQLIEAVTVEEISRVAQKYLHPEGAITVVVGPRAVASDK